MKTAAEALAEVPGISYADFRLLAEKRIDEAIRRGHTIASIGNTDIRGDLVTTWVNQGGAKSAPNLVTLLVAELRASGYTVTPRRGETGRDQRDYTPPAILISWASPT